MKIKPKQKSAVSDESTKETIGILNAISVVSKRLAKKMFLFEQTRAEKEREDNG